MLKFKQFEIKNRLDELTIQEWEKVNLIMGSDQPTISKYLTLFAEFGVPEKEFDELTMPEFGELIKEYNNVPQEQIDLVQTVTIDGYEYKSYEDEFMISVRDLKNIEQAFQTGTTDRMAFMVAILFKRTDLSNTEHYAPAHIKQKVKLFSKQPSTLALPFVGKVNEELEYVFKGLKEENTK
jgi:hypothetical protein